MSKPTGRVGFSFPGETAFNMYEFESLTIARGVIVITCWNPTGNLEPEAIILKIDDISGIKIVDIEECRSSRNQKSTVRSTSSGT